MTRFRNLVSSLSFSPQATSGLVFYARRLRKEKVTRTISAVAGSLALVLNMAAQSFAAPHAALASSPNDFIFGGLDQGHLKKSLLAIYDQNRDSYGHTDIQAVFNYFGITRKDLTNTSAGTINSGDHSLHSLGRQPHSSLDQKLNVPGASTDIYLRPLYTWGDNLSYSALIGRTAGGRWFAVMAGCGNIVVQPVPLSPPSLQPVKTTLKNFPTNGQSVVPGQELGYRVYFSNTGQSTAKDVTIEDPTPAGTSLVWQGSSGLKSSQYGTSSSAFPGHSATPHTYWNFPSMPGSTQGWYVDEIVKVANNVTDGQKICNTAFIRSQQNASKQTNAICNTVKLPSKPSPPPAAPPTPPPADTSPVLSQTKSATNVTQNNTDATKTTANPGDVVEYFLNTQNTGTGTQKDYVVSDDISDVLEYADILDPRGGTVANGVISWPKTDIGAGTTLTESFEIKLKPAGDPAYTTPTSASDPQSYDYQMDDVYGTAVSIPVVKPVSGQVEAASQALPQTGPGGDAVMFLFIAGCVYFYLRNRQLATEIRILRVETNSGV